MHCKGKLNREEPPADDCNISLLEQKPFDADIRLE
jgi:hypothetical protein